MPEERISPSEALRINTSKTTRSAFREKIKGSIPPGRLVDLVVSNGTPTEFPIDAVKDMKVEMTISGKKVVWDR